MPPKTPIKPSTKPAARTTAFNELEIIRDPDGVIAVITEREADGRVSFMLAREFDQGGETKRSAYLARRHIAAARRLLSDLEETLDLAEDRARARRRTA
jgi:hypothetical protein